MPDEFNQEAAREQHYKIMDAMVWAKNRIAQTTDYYYNYPPKDVAGEREILDRARLATREARDELDRVLDLLK